MITLYHAPQSRSSRMIWLLEEIGASYAIRPVSIFRPMTGDGEGDAANPHPDQRVPALTDGEALAAESLAIVLHLTERFPEAKLAPAVGDRSRVEFLTWIGWYACEMEPALFAGLGGELAASPHKQRNFDLVVRRIETALAEGPYMMGERFSVVDVLVGSALAFGRQAFPESPGIDAYVTRCQARPAAVRGAALDGAAGRQKAA